MLKAKGDEELEWSHTNNKWRGKPDGAGIQLPSATTAHLLYKSSWPKLRA